MLHSIRYDKTNLEIIWLHGPCRDGAWFPCFQVPCLVSHHQLLVFILQDPNNLVVLGVWGVIPPAPLCVGFKG